MRRQRIAARTVEYVKTLRDAAGVKVFLEPPRASFQASGPTRGGANAPVTIYEERRAGPGRGHPEVRVRGGGGSAKFNACLESHKVGSTPTFFLNGRMVIGAAPLEQFTKIIDDELARVTPAKNVAAGSK